MSIDDRLNEGAANVVALAREGNVLKCKSQMYFLAKDALANTTSISKTTYDNVNRSLTEANTICDAYGKIQ